ncbi:beta-ketoacyl-ACP synthase III [Oscillospiraceae bacterium PP1C4]
MTGLKLCATGCYLPDNVVDNNAFAAIVDTSDEWIRSRSGIVTRHIANGDTAWSMGVKAAQNALETAGMDAEQVDLILVTSVTPDYITPSTSCVIQQSLGAVNAACIDLNCACAGFVYALDMARRYLACGDIKTVLIISTELLSRIVNYEDRSTCVLFGDGAGACLVQAGEGLFASHLGADGAGMHLMFAKYPVSKSPFTNQPVIENEISQSSEGNGTLFMGGREVYKFATRVMPEAIEKSCEKLGISPAELDWIVPHQANIRIVQTAMQHLNLPMEKAWMSIDHCGNTSSASIPIALDELIKSGKLKRGDMLGIAGFGAGLTYGGAVFEY